MAARLGKPGYVRRRNGPREDALWRLWYRRRICLHDGSRRSRYEVSRIRGPHTGTRTQIGRVEGRRSLPSEQQRFATKENSWQLTQYFTTPGSRQIECQRLSKRLPLPPEQSAPLVQTRGSFGCAAQ